MLESSRSCELPSDSQQAVRCLGLHYINEKQPGWTRRRCGKGFSYQDEKGCTIRDDKKLERIKSIAIPPAWEKVWISPDPQGYIQATGRDQRNRKQYRYHCDWNLAREQFKYHRMINFGEALPKIHWQVKEDLKLPDLPRRKVLALIVSLLSRTCIRVGNEQYRKENNSYGLTTLRNRHVGIEGDTMEFHFRGKHGKEHRIALHDRRLAKVIHCCHELPGQELFQFVDHEGQRHTVDSGDVNHYLQEITGEDFTSKDFRTWAGTLEAALALQIVGPFYNKADMHKKILEATRAAARQLGNRPATARKHYVHPAIFEAYVAGNPLHLYPLNDCNKESISLLTMDESQLYDIEKKLLAFLKQTEATAEKRMSSKETT
jgi:DNA topoisomerase-1